MVDQIRRPTGDGDLSGLWTYSSGTTAWNLVDDDPVNDADYVVSPNIAALTYHYFTFDAFSIPAGATINSVALFYRVKDYGGTNSVRAAVKVGGTLYGTVDAGVNPGNIWTGLSFTFTVNPKSGAAWTADDINGAGANALQQFGISSSDAAPALYLSQIYLVVTYTESSSEYHGASAELTAAASLTASGVKTGSGSAEVSAVAGSTTVAVKAGLTVAECTTVAGISAAGFKVGGCSAQCGAVAGIIADCARGMEEVASSAVVTAVAGSVSFGAKLSRSPPFLSAMAGSVTIGLKVPTGAAIIETFYAVSASTRTFTGKSATTRSFIKKSRLR